MTPDAGRRERANQFAGSAWQQYGQALHRFLVRRLRHPENAQDLAQEVYLRILRFGNKDLIRDPHAYLYLIASHVVYEFKMKARRERVVFDSELMDERAELLSEEHAEGPLEERVSAEQTLESLLGQLTPTCRMVFILRKRDGLSYPQIAEKLDISVHTVKKYMFRAGAQLRAAQWT